jgi:hypothetical protein
MIVQATLGAGISVVLAVASYELYEKQLLRLKDRLAPPRAPAGASELTRTPA